MKQLDTYISEKLVINKNTQLFSYQPKDKKELRSILKDRLNEDPNANLNDIDVSQITDMSELFLGLDPHNIDISEWDVSNVENMANMFINCQDLICDISNWNVSNVKCTGNMFYGCKSLKNRPSWY